MQVIQAPKRTIWLSHPRIKQLLLSLGSGVQLINGCCSLKGPIDSPLRKYCEDNGEIIGLYSDGLGVANSEFRRNEVVFETEQGTKIEISYPKNKFISEVTPSQVVGYSLRVALWDQTGKVDLVLVNRKTLEVLEKKREVEDARFVSDRSLNDTGILEIVHSNSTASLRMVNDDLSIAWVFSTDLRGASTQCSKHLRLGQNVVINEGTKNRKETGVLASVDGSSGELIWRREFERQIDALVGVTEAEVAVLNSEKLILANSANGKVIKQVSSGFPAWANSNSAAKHDNLLLTASKKANLIRIYELPDLHLVHEQDLTGTGWFVDGKVEQIGDKFYIRMAGKSTFRAGLLELDPSDFSSPLEIEAEPNLVVSQPAEVEGPVTLHYKEANVSQLARFIEINAMDQANWQGEEGRGLNNANPLFNGTIRVICENTIDPENQLKALLARLKAHIEKEADSWGIRCGRNERKINVSYEIID